MQYAGLGMVTASDLAILGVGSAFLRLVIGLAAYHLRMLGRRHLNHGADTDAPSKP